VSLWASDPARNVVSGFSRTNAGWLSNSNAIRVFAEKLGNTTNLSDWGLGIGD
jgi:hypothetical protein